VNEKTRERIVFLNFRPIDTKAKDNKGLKYQKDNMVPVTRNRSLLSAVIGGLEE